jgi:hypothetical protein
MVVPFQGLGLLPMAAEAPLLGTLGLLLGLPVLVILLVFGLAYLRHPETHRAAEPDVAEKPLWLGERAAPQAADSRPSIESGGPLAAGPSQTGGTGATW